MRRQAEVVDATAALRRQLERERARRRELEAEIAELRRRDAELAVEALAVVTRAAESGDWRAAASVLERRWPDRWGPPELRSRSEEAPR